MTYLTANEIDAKIKELVAKNADSTLICLYEQLYGLQDQIQIKEGVIQRTLKDIQEKCGDVSRMFDNGWDIETGSFHTLSNEITAAGSALKALRPVRHSLYFTIKGLESK